MTTITHSKVSGKADGADATKVLPSDWNDDHTITYGALGNITTSLPNDTGLAGATAKLADAGHRHAREIAPTIDIQAGSASGNTAALAAATALNAAVATGVSNGGGTIRILPPASGGYGYVTYTSLPGPDLSSAPLVNIIGFAGMTPGADSACVIEYTGAGSGTFITGTKSYACRFQNLMIRYTNTSFTGKLIGFNVLDGVDAAQFSLNNVILWGSHAVGQTAILMDVSCSIEASFTNCQFNGGGTQVLGRRSVPVSAISVANPTQITTSIAHGFTSGQGVFLGGMSTTPSILAPTQYIATVTGTTTFTIPVNVTNVAVGTGSVSNPLLDNANVVKFDNCEFRNACITPVLNMGESWSFINCNFEFLANGNVGAYTHDPGVWGRSLLFQSCWGGDQTTTNTNSYVKWAGYGLNLIGNRLGGRQVSHVTAVTIDEGGCDGYNLIGNMFDNMWAALDFGSTTGNLHGLYLGNSWTNTLGAYTPLLGTLPNGWGMYGNFNTSSLSPDAYFFGGGGAAVLRFEGDTNTTFGRNGAGALATYASLSAAGRLLAGSGGTAATLIYGNATDTNAGMQAAGSNADVPLWLESKGAGMVILDGFNGTGGTKIGRNLQMPKIISPTQLVANTDNWNPTGLSQAYMIRINVDAARTITGIVAQPAGTLFKLYNTTAFTITLSHDATSTAANRFFGPNKADVLLRQGGTVDIYYSSTDSRWLIMGA